VIELSPLTRLLGWFRQQQPNLPASTIEVFAHIAAGADCSREIRRLMEASGGTAPHRTTVTRATRALQGLPVWMGGRWHESTLPALISARPHPHITAAEHFSVNEQGKELIKLLGCAAVLQQKVHNA